MKHLSFFLVFISLAACSSKKPDKKPVVYPNNSPEVSTTNPKDTSIVAKEIASEQRSNLVTEIKFALGRTEISETQKQKISELYEKAKNTGELKEVQLITWADKEFPAKDKKDLPRSQQNLVNERNDHLEELIEGLDNDLNVTKISMAERAGALAKFTASKESQVKESLDNREAAGKISESMIIFILEN